MDRKRIANRWQKDSKGKKINSFILLPSFKGKIPQNIVPEPRKYYFLALLVLNICSFLYLTYSLYKNIVPECQEYVNYDLERQEHFLFCLKHVPICISIVLTK